MRKSLFGAVFCALLAPILVLSATAVEAQEGDECPSGVFLQDFCVITGDPPVEGPGACPVSTVVFEDGDTCYTVLPGTNPEPCLDPYEQDLPGTCTYHVLERAPAFYDTFACVRFAEVLVYGERRLDNGVECSHEPIAPLDDPCPSDADLGLVDKQCRQTVPLSDGELACPGALDVLVPPSCLQFEICPPGAAPGEVLGAPAAAGTCHVSVPADQGPDECPLGSDGIAGGCSVAVDTVTEPGCVEGRLLSGLCRDVVVGGADAGAAGCIVFAELCVYAAPPVDVEQCPVGSFESDGVCRNPVPTAPGAYACNEGQLSGRSCLLDVGLIGEFTTSCPDGWQPAGREGNFGCTRVVSAIANPDRCPPGSSGFDGSGCYIESQSVDGQVCATGELRGDWCWITGAEAIAGAAACPLSSPVYERDGTCYAIVAAEDDGSCPTTADLGLIDGVCARSYTPVVADIVCPDADNVLIDGVCGRVEDPVTGKVCIDGSEPDIVGVCRARVPFNDPTYCESPDAVVSGNICTEFAPANGDADCSGRVDLRDARFMALAAIEAITAADCPLQGVDGAMLFASDIDRNGEIALFEARWVALCAIDVVVDEACPAPAG